MRHWAAIGLGGNVSSPAGAPEQTLRAAIHEMEGAGHVQAQSSLYETEPVGSVPQPPFVNAAVLLETDLDPEALLDFLQALERRYGRDRSRDVPKGPRTLDLDLLLMDDRVLQSPRLTLPHPGLAERRFVLAPLHEIAPRLHDPRSGATITELLEALPEEGPNRSSALRKLHPRQET